MLVSCVGGRITTLSARMGHKLSRALGAIYTPPDFASFLAAWAIQDPRQRVLDVGVGAGVFVLAAHRRLAALGADVIEARDQIYGSEIDGDAYETFLAFAEASGGSFPNVIHADFFAVDFPPVDAVIGNPPYVRRTYLQDITRIRHSLSSADAVPHLTRQADLYVYFLLRAIAALKPGGRLAVITADPWLNMGYGESFKQYLRQHFDIDSVISLDRRVFPDAQVKPVLLLATRKHSGIPNRAVDEARAIHFVRVKNGLPIERLHQYLHTSATPHPDVAITKIAVGDLQVSHPWGLHFKTPDVYQAIAAHPLMTSIENLAETRIGLQTLAKEFFVLNADRVRDTQVEREFLQPLAQSSRWLSRPTIEADDPADFHLFYCSADKGDLRGTRALAYIEQGESATIPVRGKGTTVVGYQGKERIARASRSRWYDLRTAIERRGRAAILIPRLVYRTLTVVWNKAGFVPGELFIEFLPLPLVDADPEVYLAMLTSSIAEFMLRSHAQVYGGGTFNINPGQIRKVPVLNVSRLTLEQRDRLRRAYRDYLIDERHDRAGIDAVMTDILGFDAAFQRRLADALEDLLLIAASTKKQSSLHPEDVEE